MPQIIRFGVSIEKELLSKFDKIIKKEQYSNRSEAIRDLIRKGLVKEQWQSKAIVIGSISLVYDHHKRELVEKLIEIQHEFHTLVVSTQHIHVDHDNCFEVVIVKGKADQVRKLSQKMQSEKGVKYLSLSMSTTGQGIV
ncbi:MAG: nickel-responsive transcriptional regulator NikR [Candidatus Omnitrophica bacterium]|nr:nickel-responsive transcriptional regulator NikR [Candidatus Omnitrophota bacterium]MBU1047267.1 nickel-responsive transcriptional regulator NikR [Candidatus Omnitrophota bacterium]MBU1630991.1 nickel-responsive transcriptional regulator NikR [Candidatus Omnitrophota bacterium]MBU1889148.1 nickel-responsive transcriptional regulator NikR [Candidatus Omnitrophota bacterium]